MVINFMARCIISLPNENPPARIYHLNGREAFTGSIAKSYATELINRERSRLNNVNYLIGISSGSEDDKMLELIGYRILEWPSVHANHNWIFRNGIYSQKEKSLAEYRKIIFTNENKFRKLSDSKTSYLINAPNSQMLGITTIM
jgi:hypothetical protein